MILILGRGGKNLWISDGFCDDANNIEECIYDGGDCCGITVQKHFCVNCTCTGTGKLALMIWGFLFEIYEYFNQQLNWIVSLMPLVTVMDFVIKADVCAHLNIISKRTALFMDVSSSKVPQGP